MSIGKAKDSWQCFPQCWQKRICYNTSSFGCVILNFVGPNIVKNVSYLDPWDRPNFDMGWCEFQRTWEADKWSNWNYMLAFFSRSTFLLQYSMKTCLGEVFECRLLSRCSRFTEKIHVQGLHFLYFILKSCPLHKLDWLIDCLVVYSVSAWTDLISRCLHSLIAYKNRNSHSI